MFSLRTYVKRSVLHLFAFFYHTNLQVIYFFSLTILFFCWKSNTLSVSFLLLQYYSSTVCQHNCKISKQHKSYLLKLLAAFSFGWKGFFQRTSIVGIVGYQYSMQRFSLSIQHSKLPTRAFCNWLKFVWYLPLLNYLLYTTDTKRKVSYDYLTKTRRYEPVSYTHLTLPTNREV